MRIFVASWFFPPALSSEGIVTYKLLRNSRHTYDVCSSLSRQWSYRDTLPLEADNITPFPVETDDLDEWVEQAVRVFEEQHAKAPYDAFMTRSFPEQSIEVGKRIQQAHPDVPWIASIADPIAKSPYDIKAWAIDCHFLDEWEVGPFIESFRRGDIDFWRDHPEKQIAHMCELKDIEDYAIAHADGLIFPHDTLMRYVLSARRRGNAVAVHHSFDRDLYPAPSKKKQTGDSDVITLTFTGHSDDIRSLAPIVRGLREVREIDKNALDHLRIRFIGHVDEKARSLIYNYDLYNHISIEPGVKYAESLRIMEESDWLIHIDTKFDFLENAGKTVYFAGKLADYLGTDTPVLAVTGTHSPAYEIVRQAGGICCEPDDTPRLAEIFFDIATGTADCHINREYRDTFDARNVSAEYDKWIERIADKDSYSFNRPYWPEIPNLGTCTQKFLSICVPAYNVDQYLDRCLLSLASCPVADQLEVIVVDDGSPDHSADIALAYQEHYPTVFKVIRKENGGHGSTINAALAQASGIYFRVLDGDDWMDGGELANLVNNIRNKQLWADLVSSNYFQVNTRTGDLIEWMKHGDLEWYEVFDLDSVDVSDEYFTMASMMAKTELLRSVGFAIQENTYYVDVEYSLFAIPFYETVMFTDDYIYRYSIGGSEQSTNLTLFVSRYDHHNRVIRRMTSYYARYYDAMGESKRSYMKEIILKHLVTHYALGLIYDADKERGFARAADFDAFLKDTAPDLYDAFYRRCPIMLAIRAAGFNPKKGPIPRSLEAPNFRKAIRKASGTIDNSALGYRLMHNRLTARIARKFSI